MRLDFTTFQISGPSTSTTVTVANTLYGLANAGGDPALGRGRCNEDSFSVSVAGGTSTPVICGTNTGQHSKQPKKSLHFMYDHTFSNSYFSVH